MLVVSNKMPPISKKREKHTYFTKDLFEMMINCFLKELFSRYAKLLSSNLKLATC